MAAEQERIGQLVKERREALGLDQAELAHRAGVDTKTVYRAEAGKTENMRKSTRAGLAKALGIGADDLLPRHPTPNLLGTMDGTPTQLDRIEARLEELVSRPALTDEQIRALEGLARLSQEDPKRRPDQSEPEADDPAAQG